MQRRREATTQGMQREASVRTGEGITAKSRRTRRKNEEVRRAVAEEWERLGVIWRSGAQLD